MHTRACHHLRTCRQSTRGFAYFGNAVGIPLVAKGGVSMSFYSLQSYALGSVVLQ